VGPKTVASQGGGEIHLQNNITLAANISFTTSGQPPFPRPPVRPNGCFRGLPPKANS
jgi:hypothetical protein